MLDFFSIFSKGGIVLWYFNGTVGDFTNPINELIKNVILQERCGSGSYSHEQLRIQYKLDHEFDLVFVVGYQNILRLTYIDKLLTDVQLEFRDRYKNEIKSKHFFSSFEFKESFAKILRENEELSRNQVREMKTFADSNRAKKIMKQRGTLELNTNKKEDKKGKKDEDVPASPKTLKTPPSSPLQKTTDTSTSDTSTEEVRELTEDEIIRQKRELLLQGKLMKGGKKKKQNKEESKPSPQAKGKRVKENRSWNNGGSAKDTAVLDYSEAKSDDQTNGVSEQDKAMVGQMRGELKGLDVSTHNGGGVEDFELEEEEEEEENNKNTEQNQKNGDKSSVGGSVFSFFKGLAGQKAITKEAIQPVLDKMREHLCSKNVATEISEKICNSVAAKLEGKVLGTFTGVASAVRSSMEESLIQILSPKKRINILRDVMEAKKRSRPYVIVFCGVNGVGKSTNLAKICFWLLENQLRVMIAACDTFRSGAVEQLRTHTCRLKALHPNASANAPEKVFLYDKGYGKDAAAVSFEAINLASDLKCDVVLVDTAGRMQDNEPLMRSLAKLIKMNEPDLVLFVGEALVGNDGVDQLRKFNQALADHSDVNNPHLIDGIVLTKFDTIDDKVGASISMTYETGQPIVFVGTGQTYTDLRTLNVNAVVKALL